MLMHRRFLYLTWHGLGEPHCRLDEATRRYWVPAASFARTIQELRRFETMRHFEARLTFDDGNVSDYEIALPVLLQHQRQAIFFVCAGRIDAPGYLSASQVRELSAAGMTIGSHGWDHIDWRTAQDADLQHELVGSRQLLSDLVGHRIDAASVPFGAVDRRVVKAAAAAGYRRLFTSSGGLTAAQTGLIPRNSVRSHFAPERDLPCLTSQAARINARLRDPVRRMKYGLY